ncbi:tRNA (adenine(22)-N(1))-methyltransferase TrmK [Virgibacillus halophilus]|uniref:tRNA (Adenine(22)-N(1))-methyltransferase TrmK n=1 Tax=Tigheibacillus halophilus TaxID=361280 RepID=A0ABU5CBK4_9BACI|nr:tRNA (adenine(22)-N(1))-methyltransferase TrmK [Virgibacillus halophilus]
MTEQINLSKRLETVASFVDANQLCADIGSDHAYLPCYICQQNSGARAIAGEVNAGPFNSARHTVKKT